jgi:hypothetical protein
VEEAGIRDELEYRPLPIDARLSPEGAVVGVGGKVAPRVTELRDSLLRRLLVPPEAPTKQKTKTKNKKHKIIKTKASIK